MRIYAFLAGMWALIILGGGMAVLVLGPLDFGSEHHQMLGAAVAKAVAAILMVVLWVAILARLKGYVFRRS